MIAGLVLMASAAMAAGLDGKWTAEVKVTSKKKGDSTQTVTFDLKTAGEKLEGSVSAGRKGAAVAIQEGKLEGSKFSFVTVVTSKKKGEQKMTWEGTLEGETLKGTRAAQGAKRGQEFTAKRAS